MKIQQMAFMLIAIMVFFGLVGLLILSFTFSNLKGTASDLQEENARLLVTRLANSPEFSCGNAFGSSKARCVDSDKVMALKKNIAIYDGFWGVSGIEIVKIVSDLPAGTECSGTSYPDNCNLIKILEGDGGVSIGNFVSLCRKEFDDSNDNYDKCELAKMYVSYKELQ